MQSGNFKEPLCSRGEMTEPATLTIISDNKSVQGSINIEEAVMSSAGGGRDTSDEGVICASSRKT